MILRGIGALLLAVLVGCTTAHKPQWSPGQPGLQFVEGVPFIAQQARNDCGPAALASLLAHQGLSLPLVQIEAAVYDERLGGTLLADMENFARLQGQEPRSGRGDPEWLQAMIDAGRPVVILVDMGFGPLRRPHYLVVFGYDSERFLVYDGRSAGVFIDRADLASRWEAMNRLYLYLHTTDAQEDGAEQAGQG
ncbi:C39 family peptidase [Geoalkalibacter halelectricus]|uniref:C39 family peptidase n=1 Tax=Geoalkalibacter halelectricus TaxID=2847045 RepID=A0ABY5ZSJ6_9BACT|nr:C39 family peptidase [Geoalkalibacter halelectricus]UWZ80875.1 C39 family peptidase [Geoalkalibacter halelectricus]